MGSPRPCDLRPAKMTSKLNGDLVSKAVEEILSYSQGETYKKGDTEIVGKKRKFTESIELQVGEERLSIGWCYQVLTV